MDYYSACDLPTNDLSCHQHLHLFIIHRPSSEKGMWHDLMVRHSALAVPHLDCIADANGVFTSFTGEDCHLGFHVHQYGVK